MGFLRIYLALCVVHAHTGNLFTWPVPKGNTAVQLFFVISGFYMAMVLSGRYATIRDFYKSRWMRISVPFYVHLAAITGVSILSGLFLSQWLALHAYAHAPLSHNGLIGILLTVISNFTIFGQDAVLFFQDHAETGLRFTANHALDPFPLHRFLVIPQCWSVSLELIFYAAAPFLNKLRTLQLFAALIGLTIIRLLTLNYGGLDHSPWNYRFFPFELPFFISGMLAWRFCNIIPRNHPSGARPSPVFYLLLCIGIVLAGIAVRRLSWEGSFRIGQPNTDTILLFASAPLIALLFFATRSHSFDRVIGELSYPIYLNHLIIIVTLRAIPSLAPLQAYFGMITAILSVIFAAWFWHSFLRNFEKRRHRIFYPHPEVPSGLTSPPHSHK